jgi:hypothetical protein
MTEKPHPNDDNEANCLVCRYYQLGRIMRYLKKERTEIEKKLKKQNFSLTQLRKEDKK